MKMNYNSWFYRTHAYLQNAGRNGFVDYNDTKWVDVSYRFSRLVDIRSGLFYEQPYGVISNRRGFNKLIDLLEKSNYDFDDINDSLVDAYKHSLTNAMSRMLVNTHAVMFKCSNTDKRYVTSDRFSKYYIVEAPFNQLHFGDRDEFIRQQLEKMHTEANDKYIPLTEFITSPYTDLLGFTLMCCVNGKICNDCLVAIDDKGFKFKVNWPYDYKECSFVVYKLDNSRVFITKTSYTDLVNNTSVIKFTCPDAHGESCIVNLYDARYAQTTPSVPNFGTLTKNGLELKNLQQFTLNEFERLHTSEVTVVIYAIQYFHEVPNVYPAVNYYDIVDTRRVFVESGDRVVEGKENKQVFASSTTDINALEVCTPPIVLDRAATTSFTTIVKCLKLRENMAPLYDNFKQVGVRLSSGKRMTDTDLTGIKETLRRAQMYLKVYYKTYIEGALLTSLVDSERMDAFEKFMTNLSNLIEKATLENLPQYTDFNLFPQLYDVEYITFIDYVLKPFNGNKLSAFSDIIKTSSNYFVSDNTNRFNRPVSEQCFITLKYDRVDDCWGFDVPSIEHFKGVGNAFYINNDLKGDEIFKFFVLYTDTESPSEYTTTPLNLNQVFDFDKFYDEVEKHIGYIRYWHAENKIMKMCKTIYNEYTSEKAVQVLSKILKRKLDGEDIIDQYPSEMNYEPSNASSLNWENFNEVSDEAPLSVNFLFYTIALMNGNEDKLQAYFYRRLIERKHSNRYADIDVASIIDTSYMVPVNYSVLTLSPTRVDTSSSSIPIAPGIYSFYGMPFVTDNNGNFVTQSPYRYVFNVYENDKHYPMITENDISDDEVYISYSNIGSYGVSSICYRHDIMIARLLTRYLISAYDTLSYLQTNYKKPYNLTEDLKSSAAHIRSTLSEISSYTTKHMNDFINPSTMDIIDEVMINNVENKLFQVVGMMESIRQIQYNGRTKTIEEVSNELLKTLKSVHRNTGFDDGVEKRVRNLYNHFKKINTLQSIYDFKKWVEGIDLEMIDALDDMRSENEHSVYGGSHVFQNFSIAFHYYIEEKNVIAIIDSLKTFIDEMFDANFSTHFEPIINYCEDIIENWIFDFFVLENIEYDNTTTYSEEPYMITVDVTASDQFHPKKGQVIDVNSTLIFEPIVEKVGSSWKINSISKVCEYAFFLGTDLSVSMNVLDKDGNTLDTISGTMTFSRIGSSADEMVTFNQYPNMKNSCIDIQNIHEEYEVHSEGNDSYIVNRKFGKMNYELLVGNSYTQLDHESELILERKTMLQGSVDRIYLPGMILNKLANREFGQHASFEVYFKPSQVLHLPIDEGVMTSVGGKYFVGQTLYLATDDERYVFPVIVTAVDMSESSGFVEAVVDGLKAKWLKISDMQDIKRYMEEPIECTVVDDNISNFLDEYNHSDYGVYQIPEYPRALDPSDEDNPNAYSMPGDPIFVTSNAPYVYTRLNWIFNEDVPNRYMDDNPQDHHMIYIGSTDSLEEGKDIRIKLINHSFEPSTDPEIYPVLKTEPDDHFVWAEEAKVFDEIYRTTNGEIANADHAISRAWQGWYMNPNKTIAAWQEFQIMIQDLESYRTRLIDKSDRVLSYINQLEYPTTWYNVATYETAKAYIDNGRAVRDYGRIVNIRNIPYTDSLEVYIYDWDNHEWVDPSLYTTTVEVIDSVKIGEYEDYNTTRVMNSITITPENGFPTSRDLLIYFAYDKSDVFEDININPLTCDVRFKPLLTLDSSVTDYDPYSKINIRKHFDGHEEYTFDEYSDIENFSGNGWLCERPQPSGKYVNTPNIRFGNMVAINNGNELPYSDFDLYVKIPFDDVTTSVKHMESTFSTDIVQPIDGFVPNQTIKLICISNDNRSAYDGNISSVMFEAVTSLDDDEPVLTIVNSTLPGYVSGTYICTVFKDNMYPHSGGVISVTVTPEQTDVVNGNWVKIISPFYKIIPDEFVIVPKSSISGKITFKFHSEYLKSVDDDILIHNEDNEWNPYEFYYNTKKDIRYPIGEVRKNSYSERFVIDKTLNPDVDTVKNTYLSICRYSCQKIPKDGIIDMTGYLPTPLSRSHYEFWVNGRYLRDEVNIISPTSIQLTNLKSLRNFECVELVDDIDDSILSTKGNVYIDLNGSVYASHKLAAMKGENVYSQSIKYMFNANNQQPMQTYTKAIISNPNNKNVEKDILETVQFANDNPTYYEELFNIPSINGVDIYSPMSYHLGFVETPNQKVLEMFDRVWRREQCTNPLFPNTHIRDLNLVNGENIILHSRYSGDDDMYILYATGISNGFFTFYISTSSTGMIDETDKTIKILPFIRTGVFVYVDKSVQGKWLCCTHPNVKPIKIM